MTKSPIFIVGDPHGRWTRLHDACRKSPVAGHILLLGDCDLEQPLAQVLADEIAAGWRVRWIVGNHDTDSVANYDNLYGSLPDGNLGNRWVSAGGLIVGGLGGTYRGKIWYPRYGDSEAPVYATRADYMRQVRPTDRFRGGVPLGLRSAIWPEDHKALSAFKLDVLLSHEAPMTAAMGDKGFLGLSELLDATGARLSVIIITITPKIWFCHPVAHAGLSGWQKATSGSSKCRSQHDGVFGLRSQQPVGIQLSPGGRMGA